MSPSATTQTNPNNKRMATSWLKTYASAVPHLEESFGGKIQLFGMHELHREAFGRNRCVPLTGLLADPSGAASSR
jgi:hypothetical protein